MDKIVCVVLSMLIFCVCFIGCTASTILETTIVYEEIPQNEITLDDGKTVVYEPISYNIAVKKGAVVWMNFTAYESGVNNQEINLQYGDCSVTMIDDKGCPLKGLKLSDLENRFYYVEDSKEDNIRTTLICDKVTGVGYAFIDEYSGFIFRTKEQSIEVIPPIVVNE